MNTNEKTTHRVPLQNGHQKVNDPEEGYPLYPEEEDIYMRGRKSRKLNPDEVTNITLPPKHRDKHYLNEELPGDRLELLDVEPDEEVLLGIEDEENSYYSLGGDDHIDLEENLE